MVTVNQFLLGNAAICAMLGIKQISEDEVPLWDMGLWQPEWKRLRDVMVITEGNNPARGAWRGTVPFHDNWTLLMWPVRFIMSWQWSADPKLNTSRADLRYTLNRKYDLEATYLMVADFAIMYANSGYALKAKNQQQ